MPAAPAAVADRAAAGVRPSTLGRRVAAIAHAHDLAGMASPTAAKLVLAVLDGARRVKGAKPAQKAPATAERVIRMLDAIPDILRGKRDRALLALSIGGAFRRPELVALEAADLAFEPDGLRTDSALENRPGRAGAGDRHSPRHQAAPGAAVQAWIQAARIADGIVFRSIDRHGRIGAALTAQSVALIVKQRVQVSRPLVSILASLPTTACGGFPDQRGRVLRRRAEHDGGFPAEAQSYARRANLFKGQVGTARFGHVRQRGGNCGVD